MSTQTFERPAARTMSDALAALRQNEQVNPIVTAAPVRNERLPLATAVVLHNGTRAVICDHATGEANRYRVTWFNRHFWRVEYRWVSRGQFVLANEKAAAA